MSVETYTRILGAVGQALDLTQARGFAMRESDTGLTLELVDGRGESATYDLALSDLADLMDWAERGDMPALHMEGRGEGALHRLLERRVVETRELVGAR